MIKSSIINLNRAVDIVGGQTALANALNINPQNVQGWLKKTKLGIPAEFVLLVEKATKGEVTRSELRPDIYPPDQYP